MGDHKMNKYQKALKHLAKAQKVLNALMQEHQELPRNTTEDCDIDSIVLSVLKESRAPLSARDIGQRCRPFRRMTPVSKEEVLGQMIDDGLIGSKNTSQTVKYFAR